MPREYMDQGFKTKRVVVAIPASNASQSSIKTWADLAGLTADDKAKVLALYCSPYAPNSSAQRGAIVVSDTNASFTAAEYWPAGSQYYIPVAQDHLNSYPADPANAGFNALVTFIMLANQGSC